MNGTCIFTQETFLSVLSGLPTGTVSTSSCAWRATASNRSAWGVAGPCDLGGLHHHGPEQVMRYVCRIVNTARETHPCSHEDGQGLQQTLQQLNNLNVPKTKLLGLNLGHKPEHQVLRGSWRFQCGQKRLGRSALMLGCRGKGLRICVAEIRLRC